MALNFTVSYTFSPSTTISSSQVNTNTSDVASVFQGLEAETKTLAKLKVDVDPTAALEVATKQYVDHYSTYRRPNLQYASATTVTVESGLDGTSGDITILFPDGSVRTETSATRTTFNITRNAVLVTSGAQSGLRTSLSEATNTIYALYAVKVTDSSTLWCTVGDTVHPTQANFSTLNSNFGTNGWVYLGYILNGAVAGQSTDICQFKQAGAITYISYIMPLAGVSGAGRDKFGVRMANAAAAQVLTSAPTAGTVVGTNFPSTATHLLWTAVTVSTQTQVYAGDSNISTTAGTAVMSLALCTGIEYAGSFWLTAASGAGVAVASGVNGGMGLLMWGWVDGVLGVGSNPLL